MTWLEMANLLYERSNSLSPQGANVHLDTAEWLRTWTPHQTQAAEAAARYFAVAREWPLVPQEVRCQLYFRCLYAIETCIEYHAQGVKPPDCPKMEQERLESLLVESWRLGGLEWAERRYAARSKPARSEPIRHPRISRATSNAPRNPYGGTQGKRLPGH